MKRPPIAVMLCVSAAAVLAGTVWADTVIKSAPPPFYTFGGGPFLLEDGSLFTVNDGEWAAIAFYRPPELADENGAEPDDGFDLLNDSDPDVFDTPLLIDGDIHLSDDGLRMVKVHGLGAVPIWFVRVDELEALAADGVLTVDELLAAESLQIGTATTYVEENHVSGVHRVSHLTVVASGTLADGGTFDFRAVEVGLELKQVQIKFKD